MLDDTETPSSGAEGAAASDDTTGGATRGKLRDFAQTALQSVADRSIELVKQGRFDELDPKMREFLASGIDTIRPTDPVREPGEAEIPADLKRYADIGKQTVAAQNLAKIEGTVREKVLQENWVSDAKELFAEFNDTEIDVKDWQKVDPTDRRSFPMTEAGYRSWRSAVNQFRRAQYGSTTPAGAETGAVDADRAAAGARGRSPQPRATATGQSTELQKAKAVLDGKGSKDEYRESLKARGIGV